jgi:hypothetical protein
LYFWGVLGICLLGSLINILTKRIIANWLFVHNPVFSSLLGLLNEVIWTVLLHYLFALNEHNFKSYIAFLVNKILPQF